MRKILHLIILCLLNGMFYANTKPAIGFIENKGQIHDQNFKANTAVKYLLSVPGMNIQLKQNSFSYDTYLVEQKNTETTRETPLAKLKRPAVENTYYFHRVDVEFIGANTQPEIVAENPSETYYNYYTTGTSEQGATNVRSYEKVTYKNIYPNIDLEFIAKNGKMKYNFILHYGADMNVIKWKYHGANTSEIKNNNISIAVKQGEFDEAIPESYVEYRNTHSDVRINFKQEKNTFGFVSDEKVSINKGEILVIDPILNILWATYFGGSGDDFTGGSSLDAAGNLYTSGTTASLNQIATSGIHQGTYGGGTYDSFIAKFSPSGSLLWASYLGGSGDDQGYSTAVDNFGNIYLAGFTSSTLNISSSGAFQTTYGGGAYDTFLAKFNNMGSIIWSTYYGGNGNDYSTGCDVSKTGDIFLSGWTNSPNNISSPGAYQLNFGGGPNDAFLVKFNMSGNRQWGTYFGDTGDDYATSCAIDGVGNAYLVGLASSTVNISTVGSYQTNLGGLNDGFIAKFNKNGLRVWSSYFGGSDNDAVYDVHCDMYSDLYLTGTTTSTNSISTPFAYQTTYGGGTEDGFISRFDSTGVRQWATYYGGNNFDYGFCITSDTNNVYVCGGTRSGSQISVPNTYQNNLSSSVYSDAFMTKFSKSGLIIWGTYFGDWLNDFGISIEVNAIKDIYLNGYTNGSLTMTSGAYQTTFGGAINDGYIAKFRQNISTNILQLEPSDKSILVYPNPNSGSFTIQTKEDVILEIVNELGQVVKVVKLDANNNHQTTITGLADGVYCLKDKLSGTIIKNKIVVVR